MATAVPYRSYQNNSVSSTLSYRDRGPSLSSVPGSLTSSNTSGSPKQTKLSSQRSLLHTPPLESPASSARNSSLAIEQTRRPSKRLKSQYPLDAPERHVEYILVASFDIDRGSTMEHQYPGAISPDENMLAELMLPDQTHMRNQDWTIFFLHKDAGSEEEEVVEKEARRAERLRRKQERSEALARGEVQEEDSSEDESESDDDEDDEPEPPLMYVLNLVNTKKDSTVKRGAIVKAMAICTRHSFLHIYKPLLLLALEEYFKSPIPETLAALYNAVNAMDLSLMPRLSYLERNILQATELKDVFVEKFERMIQQRLDDEAASGEAVQLSPTKTRSRYTIPRDTHEFETKVIYHDIPIPIKVPTAISSETVGDFSLIKLVQTFGGPHSSSPQAFALHAHLTTSGAYTHPIIVLINAMLTQKRIIFLGHNRPSGEVAEAVLAACALGSGGVLRGFTRHAFPYTDLTKVDDLLKVPGFIAGVTNPAFAHHPEWWDLLCDLPTGRMKISSSLEPAPTTEGSLAFQQQNSTAVSSSTQNVTAANDPTGDTGFMEDVNRAIAQRHGEAAVRFKFRGYITKFTRIAAAFEESVYGASNLYAIPPTETDPPFMPTGSPIKGRANGATDSPSSDELSHLRGHGYVWPDEACKNKELAASVSRIEGWRTTRSYYSFISDLAHQHSHLYPNSAVSPKSPGTPSFRPTRVDLQHHHDRLRTLKLSHQASAAIYLAISSASMDYESICHLLTITPESQGGLFYVSLGLWHPDQRVRTEIVGLLERVQAHPVGKHFWNRVGGWAKMGFWRGRRERDAASNNAPDGDGENVDGPDVVRANFDSFGTKVGRAS